jgi:glycosyltransferase involved in cell wall biosynthesis
LNALPSHQSLLSHAAPQALSRTVRFGIVGPYTPTPNGLARFGAGLSGALCAHGSQSGVIRMADGQNSMCKDLLNEVDVAIIQHEFGSYGSVAGDEVLDIIDGLRVPAIVIAHAIPKTPTSHQRSVLEKIAAQSGHVVVMSDTARQRLYAGYAVDRRKVTTIPHGATVPNSPRAKRPSRPTILTWGLLGPGKGIERVIDAMPSLRDVPGRPRYLVAGPTHPKVLAAEGEAYRNARIEQARRNGVADSVSFDSGYYDNAMLTALIQQASVVVLPYDSTEQVTSGVLVDAIANGRPVVATAFPHAVELLSSGAGIIVGHDDSAALATTLHQIITQPRLAGAMAAEARCRAPEMAWPVVASAYVGLANRLLGQGRTGFMQP